jgi:hypothetical protein
MINNNIDNLRTETREGFRQVNEKLDNIVTKEQCQEHRSNCNNKNEWTVKKITAVSGAVIGILTTAGTLVLSIAKAFGFGG